MAIYLVKFDNFPTYVKVGMSTDTYKRIKAHIADNGSISDLVEFETPKGVSDKTTERLLLDTLRPRLSKQSREIREVRGWTEFLPVEKFDEAVAVLEGLGYVSTALSVADFTGITPGNPFASRVLQLKKAVELLRVVDAVILTVLIAGKRFPKTLEGFEAICKESGTETGWCDDFTFYAAAQFHQKYPEGVVHQSIDQILMAGEE